MAPIPRARGGSFERPFTYTGVDYFGPLLVNVGRRKEKSWVALFTCLTLREVHFEIAYSLDTSSCIMCLPNFMALRGTPREIFSDNGTNFRATEKAVREELKKIEHDKITIKFDGIKWRFNPSGAPHMGGAWERLVRTTKGILKNICPSYSFNDEGLRNALKEAHFIINSRPLTFVSLDSEDDAVPTPNHLLLGSANGYADTFQQKVPPITIGSFIKRRSTTTNLLELTSFVIDGFFVDELLPRNLWLKGRVTDAMMANDGQVRRVTIKMQHGAIERPATKVAVLDVDLENGN
ncbi:uncharacterized protein [Drosophila bipectinata]|uniref:uncharacterized protein n=1 Tax=Drosophila bipectinata TaxID=42026 RepID=UPI0038B2DC92